MTRRTGFSIAFILSALAWSGCSSSKPPAEPPKATETAPATAAQAPPAPEAPTHALAGTAQSVDPKGGSLVVRTKDGKDHTVEITADTKVASLHDSAVEVGRGAESIAKITASEVKKGTVVVIHYTEKEGKLVAHEVKSGSKAAVKETEVVVKKVDAEGRKIVVKTRDGAEHVFEVGKDATVATGEKLSDWAKLAGAKIKEGSKATIQYSEQSGKKVAHFVQH